MGDHATLKEDSSKKIARVIFILSKVQSEWKNGPLMWRGRVSGEYFAVILLDNK